MGLHGKNRDHEIVGETRVTQEPSVFWEPFAQTACKGDNSHCQYERRYKQVDWKRHVQFQSVTAGGCWDEVRVKPLESRPQKAEAGLDRGAKICLWRRKFIQQQSEVERHDAPHQRDMVERRGDERREF